MNLGLQNKKALVTASSSGIGLAIAKVLAEEGSEVYVNGRSDASVNEGMASIQSVVPQAVLHPLVADNGTKAGCDKTIAQIEDLDILVNNLGIYEAVSFFEEEDENWQKLFETNIMSGVRLARHYLQKMLTRGQGRVVFISSESGLTPAPEMTHYSATKTMQLGISRALAELTKGTEVTVNAVLPGPTKTDSVEKFVSEVYPDLTQEEANKKFIQENRPTSLIQRFINPEEIGNVVAFVCSQNASAINGSNIRAEGGLVRSAF